MIAAVVLGFVRSSPAHATVIGLLTTPFDNSIWAIIKVAHTFDDSVATCKADLKNNLNNTLHGNTTSTHDGTADHDCISAPAAKAIFITTFALELLLQLCAFSVIVRFTHFQ
jgi:hypothetical protein